MDNNRHYRELIFVDDQYVDIDLRFHTHPMSNDITLLKEEEAIKSALKNIVFTEPGERPFNPKFGVPFNSLLFDLVRLNPFDFERKVEAAINRSEKRIKVDNIIFSEYSDNNAVSLTIIFSLLKLGVPHTLEINLKRTK